MPRAVVLPSLARSSRSAEKDKSSDEEGVFASGPESQGDAERSRGDEYTERLVKYIPAEALTFFLSVSSWTGISDAVLIALVVVGALGAALWASNRNRRLGLSLRQPTARVATVTIVAFLAWSVGTSGSVQALVGASQEAAVIAMTVVAFLLPAVDEALALHGGAPTA